MIVCSVRSFGVLGPECISIEISLSKVRGSCFGLADSRPVLEINELRVPMVPCLMGMFKDSRAKQQAWIYDTNLYQLKFD